MLVFFSFTLAGLHPRWLAHVQGAPGEAVTISFAKQDGSAWQWIDVPCVLSDGGSAMLDAAAGSCM